MRRFFPLIQWGMIIVLIITCCASILSIPYYMYWQRHIFGQLESEKIMGRSLDAQYRLLQLEIATLSQPTRISHLAEKQQRMILPPQKYVFDLPLR